ncbi:MAG: hypothetical protein ACKVOE_04275 [Rickettsiales bacterium]
MRKYIVIALVLVVLGVGASILLIPGKEEVAHNQAIDAGIAAPNTQLAANVDVEAEYNKGNRSFPIIAGLADKRVAEGKRDDAIKLLEEYATANPNDAQGHKKLAEQYQLAGRQADYNTQLELVASAEPTEANLRVLSDIYNANKDYPKQAEVLRKIIDITKGEKPQTYVDLATIQVVIGDQDGAYKTVNELRAKHPDFTSYPMTRILVSSLAQQGKIDEAVKIANDWINAPSAPLANPTAPANAAPATPATPLDAATADPKPGELADLCNILHYAGYADKAIALVEPHLDMLERSPELVVAYVNANITAGRADHAYAILQKIDEAGRMTAALYVPYLKLALQREDVPAAETIANKLDTLVFSEEQALDIIEVARAGQAPSVLTILTTRFADAKVLENKPVLAAVISILKNSKDQDSKIETALNLQLSSVQRIRLGESCARAHKTACFDAILKQFPPLDNMSPAQIAEYAQLFIIAERPGELVDPVGAKAQLPNAHADVQSAWHRLAAAAGRHDVLKPWLEQNANTTPEAHLQELFYLANDRHQGVVAGDIAERLYARDPSSINRDILINGFVSAGNYDKAVPLLRDKLREPGTNDGQYLSVLSKLARKDANARKEIADYAQAALQSGHGDARQQLNYAYILINNGRRDAAIPFAKQYASERGGEWKKMYAQLTQKPGKGGAPAVKQTREQLIAMANSKTISAANKRQVAFQLLNDGYKADATTVFADLARDKGPDSQEVKDLLFLWGGKLNGEQLKWIETRAASASPYDKNRWAELINGRADDQAVLQYVSATPDALYNAPLRKRYFSVLARTGSRQNYEVAMRNWVAQTTDVPALTDYSSIALASGYREAARAGYSRVLALDPNNAKALSSMASLDFAKGNYKSAEAPLNQYLATGQGAPDTDPAQAHFLKAQLLKRQGNKAAAAQEFNEVVRMTNSQAPDALSRLYTAQFNLGQNAQAVAGFEALLASHPDDKSILADYMSALIENKMFDDATRVANQYDKTSPYYGKGASLNGSAANVSAIERFSKGREIKISFADSIEGRAPVKQKDLDKLAWLERSELGYDSLTISAKPGYVVRYVPTANEQFAVVASPEVSPQVETERQQELRLQLLYAQIEQQTGQTERAKQRLAAIKQYYPQDPQLLTAQAGVASAQGNRDDALELLQQAHVQSPDNEDIAATIRSFGQSGGGSAQRLQYVRAGYDYRRYGRDADSIYSLSGVASLPGNNETGLTLRNDHVNGLGSERNSAELFLAHYFNNGSRLQGSVFTSGAWFDSGFYQDESNVGGGLYYAFDNPLGRSELIGEYSKPYWDFPNAAAFYATRTRGGIKHFVAINPRLSVGGELSYNSYNIETGDLSPTFALAGVDSGEDILQTVLARLSATYGFLLQTPTQPFLGVGLGVDTEYVINRNQPNINFLDSRQVNQLTGVYRDDFRTGTHVLLGAGWVYDSENDLNGPVVEGRVGQDITQQVQFDVHGRYGLVSRGSSFNSDSSALEVGAGLQYQF